MEEIQEEEMVVVVEEPVENSGEEEERGNSGTEKAEKRNEEEERGGDSSNNNSGGGEEQVAVQEEEEKKEKEEREEEKELIISSKGVEEKDEGGNEIVEEEEEEERKSGEENSKIIAVAAERKTEENFENGDSSQRQNHQEEETTHQHHHPPPTTTTMSPLREGEEEEEEEEAIIDDDNDEENHHPLVETSPPLSSVAAIVVTPSVSAAVARDLDEEIQGDRNGGVSFSKSRPEEQTIEGNSSSGADDDGRVAFTYNRREITGSSPPVPRVRPRTAVGNRGKFANQPPPPSVFSRDLGPQILSFQDDLDSVDGDEGLIFSGNNASFDFIDTETTSSDSFGRQAENAVTFNNNNNNNNGKTPTPKSKLRIASELYNVRGGGGGQQGGTPVRVGRPVSASAVDYSTPPRQGGGNIGGGGGGGATLPRAKSAGGNNKNSGVHAQIISTPPRYPSKNLFKQQQQQSQPQRAWRQQQQQRDSSSSPKRNEQPQQRPVSAMTVRELEKKSKSSLENISEGQFAGRGLARNSTSSSKNASVSKRAQSPTQRASSAKKRQPITTTSAAAATNSGSDSEDGMIRNNNNNTHSRKRMVLIRRPASAEPALIRSSQYPRPITPNSPSVLKSPISAASSPASSRSGSHTVAADSPKQKQTNRPRHLGDDSNEENVIGSDHEEEEEEEDVYIDNNDENMVNIPSPSPNNNNNLSHRPQSAPATPHGGHHHLLQTPLSSPARSFRSPGGVRFAPRPKSDLPNMGVMGCNPARLSTPPLTLTHPNIEKKMKNKVMGRWATPALFSDIDCRLDWPAVANFRSRVASTIKRVEKERLLHPFDQNVPQGLPEYNSLRDKHLSHYWANRDVETLLELKGEQSRHGWLEYIAPSDLQETVIQELCALSPLQPRIFSPAPKGRATKTKEKERVTIVSDAEGAEEAAGEAEYPLHAAQTIECVLAWKEEDVDLDLVALMYDDKASLMDCVFFHHLVSSYGGVQHAGDARPDVDGSLKTPSSCSLPSNPNKAFPDTPGTNPLIRSSSFDVHPLTRVLVSDGHPFVHEVEDNFETLRIELPFVSKQVHSIVIGITCYSGTPLSQEVGARLKLRDAATMKFIGTSRIMCNHSNAAIAAIITRINPPTSATFSSAHSTGWKALTVSMPTSAQWPADLIEPGSAAIFDRSLHIPYLLDISYCTAPRPTHSLRGKREHFSRAFAAVKEEVEQSLPLVLVRGNVGGPGQISSFEATLHMPGREKMLIFSKMALDRWPRQGEILGAIHRIIESCKPSYNFPDFRIPIRLRLLDEERSTPLYGAVVNFAALDQLPFKKSRTANDVFRVTLRSTHELPMRLPVGNYSVLVVCNGYQHAGPIAVPVEAGKEERVIAITMKKLSDGEEEEDDRYSQDLQQQLGQDVFVK